MKRLTNRWLIVLGLIVASWLCFGAAVAEAVRGAPATPVSYAGVARRSTVGAGAPGAGVTPGVGVGTPGAGAPGGNSSSSKSALWSSFSASAGGVKVKSDDDVSTPVSQLLM